MFPNKMLCSGASGIGNVNLDEVVPVSTLRYLPSAQLRYNTSTEVSQLEMWILLNSQYS